MMGLVVVLSKWSVSQGIGLTDLSESVHRFHVDPILQKLLNRVKYRKVKQRVVDSVLRKILDCQVTQPNPVLELWR